MYITYRNIVKFQQKQIPEFIIMAQEFLQTIYDKPDFNNVGYIFSGNLRTSHYFRNEDNDKYKMPMVCISNRNRLILYEKKSLKLKNYRINPGAIIQMQSALVHELTHHIQYNEERSAGELETTRNEVKFLKENHPFWYNKLFN